MITSIETTLSRFNYVFQRYAETWTERGHGTMDDALEKKGRDLGIKLFQGFVAHKWGGPGKHSGLARAELDARAAQGKGIKLRASLMQEYLSERGTLRARLRGKHGIRAIMQKVNLWRKYVGRELSLRQRGIGYLAASFLWYRSRSSQVMGTYHVYNRTGHPMGGVDRGEGYFRIIGDAEGSALVSDRYGIVAEACAEAEADMLVYLKDRDRERYDECFAELSGRGYAAA